jgi:hypothetical protein
MVSAIPEKTKAMIETQNAAIASIRNSRFMILIISVANDIFESD